MRDAHRPLTTRRELIQNTGLVAAASALTGVAVPSVHAAGTDCIQVALIGCGGRGTGAAGQALSTKQEGIVLHAICDAFKEKAEGALSNLRTKHADKVKVDDSRIFAGLDGYKKVIDSCDLVILTTPPGFRPYHFEAAIAAPRAQWPDEIVVFGAASEAFSQKNINCSIAESIERFAPVVAAARAAGIKVRAAISCAVGCPYEGDIAPERVELVARLMKDIGVQHVGVADTIGVGTPRKVQRALEATLQHFGIDEVSGHFHDTYGQALSNVYASLTAGVSEFDSSAGGLGRCPYAKGATGNLATEDLVWKLHGLGIDTGIDLDSLTDTSSWMAEQVGHSSPSRVVTALRAART